MTEDNAPASRTATDSNRLAAPSISVFFPCYNEQDNVARTVENADSDIWAESPVAICDLDRGDNPWGRIYHLLALVPVYEEEAR